MVFKSADFGFLRLADRATYPWEPLSSSTVLFIKDMGWDGQESKSPGILLSRQRASECGPEWLDFAYVSGLPAAAAEPRLEFGLRPAFPTNDFMKHLLISLDDLKSDRNLSGIQIAK